MKLLSRQFLTLESSDKKLALAFAGIGIISVILTTTVFPSLLILQASVTLLLASAIYLFLRTRRRVSPIGEDEGKSTSTTLLQPHISKLLDITFWGLLIAGLIILSQGLYARPLSFLILVSIMSSILAVQIFAGKNTAYCLIKIVIIGLLLRATAYYQFPGMVGYDSVAEVNFLSQLVANGHIGDFMKGYQHYPLAYYLTASTSFITGLGAKDSFFVLGIIEVISLVFLFLIGRQLFNEKTGLLAVVIMAVFDWHTRWGFYVKAMTLGIAWVPIIIYLLLNSRRKGNPTFLILGILSMFLIVLTHTFVTTVLLVILFFSWLIFRILRNIQSKKEFEPPITLNIVSEERLYHQW